MYQLQAKKFNTCAWSVDRCQHLTEPMMIGSYRRLKFKTQKKKSLHLSSISLQSFQILQFSQEKQLDISLNNFLIHQENVNHSMNTLDVALRPITQVFYFYNTDQFSTELP